MSEQKTRDLAPGSFKHSESDSAGPTGNNHLLVIAIDEYEHCPVLSNCLKDAHGFIEVLKERYDFTDENIQTLFNTEATRANIHASLKELKKRVTPEDSVLIYFSGHGETEDNVGYWIPVEAHPEREWEFVSTMDIKSRLNVINSFHTFVIVDACFSGSLFASYRSVKAGNENKRSRLGLAASHSKERALDGTAGENSPFSQNLLRQLKENTGILTAHKLAADLIQEVHERTQGKQTPVFKPLDVKGDDSGQYVFRLKANEGADWEACRKKGTLAVYEAFAAKYPKGEHASEAQEQIVLLRDEEAWQAAKSTHTIKAYLQYRKASPDGKYRDQSLEAIQELEEDQSWNRAKRKKTIYDYEHYLEKYPRGRYAQEAQAALNGILGEDTPVKQQPRQEPKKVAPVKESKPRLEPKEAKPKPKENRLPKAKEDKPVSAVPADTPIAKKERPTQPAAGQTTSINKKYLMIGGAVLIVAVLIIWAISSGGNKSTDLATLELFEINGKYGYRDGAGKEILAAQYEKAEPFRDGRALVTLNGRTFTIDNSGTCVANCLGTENSTNEVELSQSENPTGVKSDQPENSTPKEQPTKEPTKKPTTTSKGPAPAIIGTNGVTFNGKTYSIAKLGSLTWMAQNLDYQVGGSWCYGGKATNCQEYGRLYTFAAANKACAAMGWRLPTANEWEALKSQGAGGFSTQTGGYRNDAGKFSQLSESGYYWSNSKNALGLIKSYNFTGGKLDQENNDARLGYSCRCVR